METNMFNVYRAALVGGALLIGLTQMASAYDGNNFKLQVARYENQSDVQFSWSVKPPFNFDVFNVRVHTPDGRETQHERAGRTHGGFPLRNLIVGKTYIFKVQGCDRHTFGSKCTPWSQLVFHNVAGNDIVDGP
jgi:hypothetical protein